MGIELAILGQPIVHRDGVAVTLSTKAFALLGYLAVQGVPQRREQILTLLWPDSSDEAARKNGRNTLWAIRKALGADAVQTADDLLSLDPALDVDVWRWQHGLMSDPASVAHLYRGPLLDGLQFADADEFDLWLTIERERFTQMAIRSLSTQTMRALQAHRWNDVIELADHALAIDPLQEPLYRAVMEALAQRGERSEALRRYALLMTILERELGVEPLPETQALRDQIVQGSLVMTPSLVPAAAPPEAPPEIVYPRTPFVGRETILKQLDALLEDYQTPVVALIGGEVGIGKTRLWKEWVSQQAPQTSVMILQGLQSTQTFPFAPLVTMFSTRGCLQTIFQPATPIAPTWLAEITRLLPEGRVLLPSLPPASALPADEERRRIFEAFVQVLLVHAYPLIMIADDLHWADDATIMWLDYAVQRLAKQQLLLIVTYRAEDAPPALNDVLAGWQRHGIVQRIQIPHLTPDEAQTLLQGLGVTSERAATVAHSSGGNPLFLVEWSRTPAEMLPPQLSDLISARLGRLPAAAQQIMQTAAVLNPNFTLETLRRTSGRSEEEVIDGIDALLDSAILAEDDDRYTFVHPLIAAVVEADMSNARRRYLHRRAAHILDTAAPHRAGALAGQLMRHYQIAGDIQAAAQYADIAAEHAQQLAATSETLAFRRTALELAPTPQRQRALGLVQLWLGDIKAAREALLAVLNAYEEQGNQRGIAQTSIDIAETYLPQARTDQAIIWGERALTALGTINDPELLARINVLLGSSLRMAGAPLREAEEHLRLARDIAERNRLALLTPIGEFELGNLLTQRGDLEAALQAFDRSITFAHTANDPFREVLGHNNLAFVAIWAEQLALSHQHIDAAFALAEIWDLRLPLQYLFSTRGELALAEHDWNAAQHWFERGLELARANANSVQIANYHANFGLVEHGRGNFTAALHLFEQARDEAAEFPAVFLQSQIDLWMAETYHQLGDRESANQSLLHVRQRIAGTEHGLLAQWLERLEQTLADSTIRHAH